MDKISIILPTYNERDNIGDLIKALNQECSPEEIIVVDDNSPDGTWRVVNDLGEELKNLKLIRRLKNKGLVSAISEGILSAKGDIIIWMDADFSHPPSVITDLLNQIKQGYDIAVASRYAEGALDERKDFKRIILSKIIMRFCGLLLDSSFKDYTSGFVAIKKDILQKIPLRGYYGEYFIDFVFHAKKEGFRITEVPYVSGDRNKGKSKTNLRVIRICGRYIATVLKLCFKYKK